MIRMLVTFCHTLQPQSSQQQYSRCQSDTSANQLPVVVCRICFACLQTVVSLSLLSARSTSARLALSYSEISPNETCLPCMLRFSPAPQTPDFLCSTFTRMSILRRRVFRRLTYNYRIELSNQVMPHRSENSNKPCHQVLI